MLRSLISGIVVGATLLLAACDNADPLGLYPEPSQEIVAPLELTGRVVDAADLLSDQEELNLGEELERIENATLAQVVVVTTPGMQGHSIQDYSLRLGRGWGIGDHERNDGLLLVVAPNERQVRVEVGYGLENTVEDPEAAAIIREMMPYFEQGDYPTAIGLGVDLIKAELIAGEMKEAA